MRTGAFEILIFFICLNLGVGILHEMDALPYSIEAIETPQSIEDRIITNLGGSIAILIGGIFTGLLLNALAQGAAIALVIAALNMLVPLFDWLILGFPKLLISFGVPEIIYYPIVILVGVTWVWFLIGIVAQRYME